MPRVASVIPFYRSPFAVSYATTWVIVPLSLGLLGALEKVTNRRTTDTTIGIVAAMSVLGGGALIRWGLFLPDVTKDLNTIGTIFAVLVGLAILASPFVILWYRHGSEPQRQ